MFFYTVVLSSSIHKSKTYVLTATKLKDDNVIII